MINNLIAQDINVEFAQYQLPDNYKEYIKKITTEFQDKLSKNAIKQIQTQEELTKTINDLNHLKDFNKILNDKLTGINNVNQALINEKEKLTVKNEELENTIKQLQNIQNEQKKTIEKLQNKNKELRKENKLTKEDNKNIIEKIEVQFKNLKNELSQTNQIIIKIQNENTKLMQQTLESINQLYEENKTLKILLHQKNPQIKPDQNQ